MGIISFNLRIKLHIKLNFHESKQRPNYHSHACKIQLIIENFLITFNTMNSDEIDIAIDVMLVLEKGIEIT